MSALPPAQRLKAISNQYLKMIKSKENMPYWISSIMKVKLKRANRGKSTFKLIKDDYDGKDVDLVVFVLYKDLKGYENELDGAEYLCVFIFPLEFPFKPPEFQFLTPNGIYDMDTHPCVTIGSYHADGYKAAGGIYDFIRAIGSTLIAYDVLESGIGIISTSTTVDEKKELAQMSKQYNEENYPKIMKTMREQYDEYSKKWTTTE